MKTLLTISLALLIILACNPIDNNKRIHGNGIVEENTLTVSDFNRVESSGQYDLIFVQDSTNDILLEGESNILPLIDVYVSNNKLVIENEDNYEFDLNHPIIIVIHHTGIHEVDYSGAGEIYFQDLECSSNFSTSLSGTCTVTGNLKANNIDFKISGDGEIYTSIDCNDIEISISGTGDIDLDGIANDGVFSISGVGDIYAYDLPLKNCYTSISGTGDNYFSVSDYLNVSVAGIGNIYYKGNPTIEKHISGIGSITKVD